MFGFSANSAKADAALLKALDRSFAIIEFDPKGTILNANANFCKAMGYTIEELRGKHHSLFLEPEYAGTQEYREFWASLARGEFQSREFKRLAKGGRDVFIEASYNPVLDDKGRVVRVVKVASDTTAAKLRSSEFEGKMNAVSRVQAIIEFTPNGEIVAANENFLKAAGYTLDEIKGRHHSMFVDPKFAASPDYAAFWARLNKGEPIVDTFRRVGKGGKLILLQASYNPIFDLRGRVTKIVKFGNDFSDLATFGAGMGRLADNDFERGIDKPFEPMFEPLRRDFNVVRGTLNQTLSHIAQTAELVSSGGKEISSASEDLSHRTEQQAASLEETAAALAAVTETVRRTAAGAKQARTVVAEADGDARKSGQIVERAVAAMSRIETSSTQINQIIGVIDEIAFQTNLLALNAGVEAARAGEAGRGFAVVASEVRALAQRSAEAAKEIKSLISASSTQVGEGVKLVAETGDALTRIIAKVEQINALIASIAGGAEEQATSLHEVNAAVNQMDQAVQQNAAMAEEANAASRSLLQTADELAGAIGVFRLGPAADRRVPAAPARRAA